MSRTLFHVKHFVYSRCNSAETQPLQGLAGTPVAAAALARPAWRTVDDQGCRLVAPAATLARPTRRAMDDNKVAGLRLPPRPWRDRRGGRWTTTVASPLAPPLRSRDRRDRARRRRRHPPAPPPPGPCASARPGAGTIGWTWSRDTGAISVPVKASPESHCPGARHPGGTSSSPREHRRRSPRALPEARATGWHNAGEIYIINTTF